jgi:hypothetical protein
MRIAHNHVGRALDTILSGIPDHRRSYRRRAIASDARRPEPIADRLTLDDLADALAGLTPEQAQYLEARLARRLTGDAAPTALAANAVNHPTVGGLRPGDYGRIWERHLQRRTDDAMKPVAARTGDWAEGVRDTMIDPRFGSAFDR